MLTLSDCTKNFEKERENFKYVKQAYIIDNYDKSDLLCVETCNRMNDSYIFLFYRNKKIDICVVDDIDDKIGEKFPIATDVHIFFDRKSSDYDLYESGFGGLICVKKSIGKKFNDELNRLAHEYDVEYFNGVPNVNFVNCYWITIIRNITEQI